MVARCALQSPSRVAGDIVGNLVYIDRETSDLMAVHCAIPGIGRSNRSEHGAYEGPYKRRIKPLVFNSGKKSGKLLTVKGVAQRGICGGPGEGLVKYWASITKII